MADNIVAINLTGVRFPMDREAGPSGSTTIPGLSRSPFRFDFPPSPHPARKKRLGVAAGAGMLFPIAELLGIYGTR